MSLGTTIANLFKPAQPGIQTGGSTPPQPMSQQNPGAAAQVPPAGTSNPTAETPPDPLAAMAKIWETDPNATPPADPFSQPLFNVDGTALSNSVAKFDFVSKLPQEQKVQLAAAMREGNVDVLLDTFNRIAQQTLLTSAQLSTATAEQAGTRLAQRFRQDIPNQVRAIGLSQAKPENQTLQHPAVQPFLAMTKQAIANKNPGMSPTEITQLAEQQILGMAQALTPAQQVDPMTGRPVTVNAGTDWDTWAEL